MTRNGIIYTSVGILMACLAMIGLGYAKVSANAAERLYVSTDSIPANEYGLLLGTSPRTSSGKSNYYFDCRIDAACQLFKAGKINKIIASGGNYTQKKHGCNEPLAIRDSLTARGIPAECILLDYDGTRTIMSIINAKNIYGIDTVTLISQKYHNERAIYLADHYHLHSVGYNAETPDLTGKKIRNISREFLARIKMFIDII